MKKFVVLFSMGLLVFVGAGQVMAAGPNAKRNAGRIWAQIPFVEAGDLGQYQNTMAQGRDGIRKVLWQELMSEVQSLAEKGVPAEAVIEPMAKILLAFNDMYDVQKSRDVIKVDISLEAQFKGQFDNLFREFDVRDHQRNVELAEGSVRYSVDAHLKKLMDANTSAGAKKVSAQEIYNLLDYMAYGTFSSLGRGQFQVTLHLTSLKNNGQRSFVAQGRLTDALGALAQQLFDYFQKNEYAQWETPFTGLQWIPSPVNPSRQPYSYAEASQYCQLRGYRLPFARELILAASGTQYQQGGIASLHPDQNYAVKDQRETTGQYWLKLANRGATGGPLNAFVNASGNFWCVRGAASSEVSFVEDLWKTLRLNGHREEVVKALQTIRLAMGDFGASEEFFFATKSDVKQLRVLKSVKEAAQVLHKERIQLNIPKELLQ